MSIAKCKHIILGAKFGSESPSEQTALLREKLEELNRCCLKALNPNQNGDLQLAVMGELFRSYCHGRALANRLPRAINSLVISARLGKKLLKSLGRVTPIVAIDELSLNSGKLFLCCGFPSHSFNKSNSIENSNSFDSMTAYVTRCFGDGSWVSLDEYSVSGSSYALERRLVDRAPQTERLSVSHTRSVVRAIADLFLSFWFFCSHIKMLNSVDAALVLTRYRIRGGSYRRLYKGLASANISVSYFIMAGHDTGDFGYLNEPNVFGYAYTCPKPCLIRERSVTQSASTVSHSDVTYLLQYLDMSLVEMATNSNIVGYTKGFDTILEIKEALLESVSAPTSAKIYRKDDCGQLGFGGTLPSQLRNFCPKNTVVIFPHQPLAEEVRYSHTLFGDYISSPEFFEAFFDDLVSVFNDFPDEIRVIVKPKYDERKQGDFFSKLEKNNSRVRCVSAYTRLSDIVSVADFCISVPYTGASEAFASLGGSSFFYFPEKFALDSVRRLGSTQVLVGRSELKMVFKKLFSLGGSEA